MRFYLILLFLLIASPAVNAQQPENSPIGAGTLKEALLSRLVMEGTNRFRIENGRDPLENSPALEKAAHQHAKAMAQEGFFSHRNPVDPQQRTLTDRMLRVGLGSRPCGENIAYTFSRNFDASRSRSKNQSSSEHTYRSLAQSIVQQWIHSKGHRANLLGRQFSSIGMGFSMRKDRVGYEKVFCVQTFAAPAATFASARSSHLRWN